MPAKTPEHLIAKAMSLYALGHSSTSAAQHIGVHPATVASWARRAGIIRSPQEAKVAQHRMTPKPLPVVDFGNIYRSSDDPVKKCARCENDFPATFEFFYKRKRENHRVYLSSCCKECVKRDRLEYRQKNPEKTKEANKLSRERNGHKHAQQRALKLLFDPDAKDRMSRRNREWAARNRERVVVYRKAYYAEKKDQLRETNKRWRFRNMDLVRAARVNRKSRMRNAKGKITKHDITGIAHTQNWCCYWCNSPLEKYHVDHLIPLARGGSNSKENIVISCPTCNISRGAKSEKEFREYLSFVNDNRDKIEERRAYMRFAMRKHRNKTRTTR